MSLTFFLPNNCCVVHGEDSSVSKISAQKWCFNYSSVLLNFFLSSSSELSVSSVYVQSWVSDVRYYYFTFSRNSFKVVLFFMNLKLILQGSIETCVCTEHSLHCSSVLIPGLKHPHYHWGTGTGPPASGQAGAVYKTDRLHPHQDEPYHYASCGIGSLAGSGDETRVMAGIHTQQGPYHSGEESSYGGSGAGWPSSGGAWKYGKSSNGAHHGDFEEDDRGEMKPILSGWSQPNSSFRKSPVAGRKKVETSLVSSSSRLSDPDLSRGKPVKIWDEESWSWKDGVKLGRGSRSSSKELLPLWPRSSPSPILGRRKSDPRTKLPKPIGILK